MKPIEVVKALEKCSLLRPWQRDDPIKRYWWAVHGYIDGYVSKRYMDREIARFLKVAEKLIAEQSALATWKWLDEMAKRPLTADEQKRRQEWLAKESLRATRTELQTQRRRLREGHATLTAIRKLLARGVGRSLVLASEPATTSPT